MTRQPRAVLYSPQLLALATRLADYPLTDEFACRAEARSRTCGSTITVGLNLATSGVVEDVGMQISACAIGQASAAILAGGAKGRNAQAIADASAAIEAWLAGDGEPPDWPELEALAPALAHAGRHGALLLPWKAASAALSMPVDGR